MLGMQERASPTGVLSPANVGGVPFDSLAATLERVDVEPRSCEAEQQITTQATAPVFDPETCTQEEANHLVRSKLKFSAILRLYERGIFVPGIIGASLPTRPRTTR